MDDSGGVEKYKQIEQLSWSREERQRGKLIKIKNFPKDKKVKLFRVTVSTDRTDYIVTNDLSQNSTDEVHACERCSLESRGVSRPELSNLLALKLANVAKLESKEITSLVRFWFGLT